MNERNTDLRSAGDRIAAAGLDRDVKRVDARDLTNRENRREAQADPEISRSRSTEQDARRRDRDDQEPRNRDSGRNQDDRRKPSSRDDHSRDEDEDRDPYEVEDDEADPSNRENDEDSDDQDDGSDQDHDPDGDQSRREELYEVTVNGKREKVPLDELRTGYMKGKAFQQKTQAAAARQRNLDQFHGQAAETVKQRIQANAHALASIKEMLVGDINSPALQDMRRTDPNRWAVVRQDMQDRIDKVNSVIANLHQEHERHLEQTKEQRRMHLRQAAETEMELLTQHIPNWLQGDRDEPAVAQRVVEYLTSAGFQPQDYAEMIDHRMWLIADKARRYDEMKKADRERQRQGRPVPKSSNIRPGKTQMSAGNRNGAVPRKSVEFQRLKTAAKKTGQMRDAAKAIERLL